MDKKQEVLNTLDKLWVNIKLMQERGLTDLNTALFYISVAKRDIDKIFRSGQLETREKEND